MGELLTDPAMKAAIVGFGDDGDRVLEVIEYLRADGSDARRNGLADPGLSHIGLVCDDLDETRKSLEDKGVHFQVDGIADIAGVRTTWFADPWGVVFILPRKRVGPPLARGMPPVEKGRPERPCFAQFGWPRVALIRLPFTVGP
jgi:hypothetical protein